MVFAIIWYNASATKVAVGNQIARLSSYETIREIGTSLTLIVMRRYRITVLMNMMFEVKRSASVRTILTRKMGKSSAPMVRIRPGALAWY
jgi:hypothetical protein